MPVSVDAISRTPYAETSRPAKFAVAITDVPVLRYCAMSCAEQFDPSSSTGKISSGKATTTGSDPAKVRAQSKACPVPRISCCRTTCVRTEGGWIFASLAAAPSSRNTASSSASRSNQSSSDFLRRDEISNTSSMPAFWNSSTTKSTAGRSTTGSISLGMHLVIGKTRSVSRRHNNTLGRHQSSCLPLHLKGHRFEVKVASKGNNE